MKEIQNRIISEFLSIDHNEEGFGYSKPSENCVFYFHSESYGDHAENYIIERNKLTGEIKTTYNIRDISEISYSEEFYPHG